LIYHVLNRANGRRTIFRKPADFDAFEEILGQAIERFEMRLLAYIVMPNHWHLMLWPENDGDLSRFTGWLTLTHTQRWHAHRRTAGSGHVYQGRFKSFPIQDDEHYLTVCRYVERNALRAGLVTRAEMWRWSSLYRWKQPAAAPPLPLAPWPVRRSADWIAHVNRALTEAELQRIRRSISRGTPFGADEWNIKTIERLGLETTLRPRGRPRKK
jgi:putative transposase